MDIRLQIIDTGDDGKVYWFKVAALTAGGKVVDRDIFRFPKQAKRVLTNPPLDPLNPPTNWKPKLSVPRECNIFDYGTLADIAARRFLRRQGLIEKVGLAWAPADWRKTVGIDMPPLPGQMHLPFLADRMATMLGAELLVDAPDIAGELEALEPRPGTVTTISTDYDGRYTGSIDNCQDAITTFSVGFDAGSRTNRAFIRFPLANLPVDDEVSDIDLKVNVDSVAGTPTQDIQAYNEDGQANPSADSCATKGTRCADDASPYVDDTTAFQTTGVKTVQLPAAANTDIEAAKDAVDRFSIGMNENATTPAADVRSNFEALDGAGTDEPKLVITHAPAGAQGTVI